MMTTVMKSPIMFTKAVQQKPIANIEACRMIENTLYELIPSLERSKAKSLARQLASLRAFRSLDASTGNKCLKLRLKRLSRQLLDVAQQRRQGSTGKKEVTSVRRVSIGGGQAKVDRHHILISTVGVAKCNEILSISQEIKDIRQQSAVWTKFSQQRSQSHEEEDRGPASETLPTPIADIYFRVRLVDVMRVVNANTSMSIAELPEPYACIVQRSDWNSLLEDAKAKLAAFRKFEMEHFNEEEDLSFKCTSGMCFPSSCRK